MSLNERLEKCVAAIRRLEKSGSPASRIEIDMALEELRHLYDAVLQLNVPVVEDLPAPEPVRVAAEEPHQDSATVVVPPIIPVVEETSPTEAEPQPEEPVVEQEAPVVEPEPAPQPIVEHIPEPMPEPAPMVQDEEPSLFAPEDPSEVATPNPDSPTVEQVSSTNADTLFEEEPTAPATIWEKLQGQQATPSFADMVQPQHTLSERLAEQKAVPEPAPVSQPAEPVAPVVEPTPAPAPAPVASQPEPTPEPEPTPQPAPASPASPSLMDILKQTNTVHAPAATQRMLGDTFASPTTVEDDYVQPRKHKVDDLRTVININDKFSFMSELFHNNMKAYNDFIMALNVAASREAAMELVATVSQQYEWDENSVTVKNFHNILNRKF